MDAGRSHCLGWFRNSRSQQRMRTAAIVMADKLFDDHPQVVPLIGIRKSRHSRRILPISLSQKALALGARTGVFKTRTPKLLNSASRRGEKIPSRSWITKR